MPRPDSRLVTALLAFLSAFGPMSTDAYLPAWPGLERALGATAAQTQFSLSIFLIGFACGQLLYGSLSDRFGRRPVMLGGILLFCLASGACAVAPTPGIFILARFFQAVGACAAPVLARAVARDVHGPVRAARLLATIGTIMALAPALAPTIGAYINAWFGWRAIFAFLALYGLAAIAGVWTLLAETNKHKDDRAFAPAHMTGNILLLLRDRAYMAHTLVIAFAYCGLFAFLSGSSFVLIEAFRMTPQHYGQCFALLAGGYMIGQQVGIRLVPRLGIVPTVRCGALVCMLAGLAMAAMVGAGLEHPAAVIGPQTLFMLGFGFIMPNSMAAALAPYPQMAGLASALLGLLQMGFGALVGVLVGQLYDGSGVPMSGAIGLMGSAAFAIFTLLLRPRRAVAPTA